MSKVLVVYIFYNQKTFKEYQECYFFMPTKAITITLHQKLCARVDVAAESEHTIFSSRSGVIAHCILSALPEIEKEMRDAEK